ncbi:MAG: hypothetical protein LBU64_05735 [Planctomycetota bacterium]|jgi:F0F1-type ATP synthase membrane subunit b/b'|nr:hypothetical protein [Planctomycetota bacterium]
MPKNSARYNPKVSHHTLVIRKAKAEDAKRRGEPDPALDGSARLKPGPGVAEGEARRPSSTAAMRAPVKRPPPDSLPPPRISRDRRAVSGGMIEVRNKDDVSPLSRVTRLSGSRIPSVRIAGGDTIIRYESGKMEIRRGARRIRLRRQIIIGYAAGYFLIFGLYAYFLAAGKTSIDPWDFVERSFSRRQGTEISDLEIAALQVMRGNRTPAEVRLAEPLSFQDGNGDPVRIEAGSRLTLETAARLAQAIIEDLGRPAETRFFNRPIALYKENFLASLNWPHWLAVYNSLGFFLLILLFLWRPLMNYLGAQSRKAAAALRNARATREEAAKLGEKYLKLAGEDESLRERRLDEIGREVEAELAERLAAARRQAEDMENAIRTSFELEAVSLAARLGARAVDAACGQALRLLGERLGEREHAAAIEELAEDILARGANAARGG